MSKEIQDNESELNRRNPLGSALFIGLLIGGIFGAVGVAYFTPEAKIVEKIVTVEVPATPAVPMPEEKSVTPPKPTVPVKDKITLSKSSFQELPGWTSDDLKGIEIAFARSCKATIHKKPVWPMGRGNVAIPMIYGDWQPICEQFTKIVEVDPNVDLREFFEEALVPYLAANNDEKQGKFTGYFEAELRGSMEKSEKYKFPLYGKPKDLVSVNLGQFSDELKGRHVIGRVNESQKFEPYHQRGSIEAGDLSDQSLELVWIDDAVDVFLLQVQGSGRVILPNGDVARVGYAAHNGHGYKSIGRYLIEQGELDKHKASWGGIRGWLDKNPEKQAELFSQNPRFVFFRILDGEGPIGSQGVALTPKRSLAVDQRYIPLGSLVWLDTVQPGGSKDPLQTLMVAQDTGGAIKGPVRGDFFWGYGDKALAKAGRMNSKGRYFILLPHATAARVEEQRNAGKTDIPVE